MSTLAIVMMVSTMGIIIAFTSYFFFKVLRTPNKSELDGEQEE